MQRQIICCLAQTTSTFLERLGRADLDYFENDTDVMCERCTKIYLSPKPEEEKSKKRLAKWKEKENRKRLRKKYEGELTKYLEKCPRCEKVAKSEEPLEFLRASTTCASCGIVWVFLGFVKHTGHSAIWVMDEMQLHDGKLSGHIHDSGLFWEWR